MNFLKKKIKGHKKAIEDDEDYGDYIPVAPPHPDDLLRNQQNLATPFAVNNEYFTKSNQSIQPTTADSSNQDNNEEQPKNQPKFIRKPKEEKEEWKFFEQLTARVQATVSKTEKELEKIKATTNVDEIEAKTEKEYYFHEDLENLNQQFEEKFSSLETEKKRSKKSEIKSPSVALNLNEKLKSSASNQQITSPNQPTPTSLKSFPTSLTSSSIGKKSSTVATTTSEWIGFNRDSVEILDDDDEDSEELRQKEEERQKKLEEEELKRKREELLKERLAKEFGFIEPEGSKNINESSLDKIINYEEDYLDDPFNTEYAEKKYESTKDLTIKIEKLEKELSSTHINKPTTLDLSNNSNLNKQIDRTTSSQNIKGYSDNKSLGNKYSSVPCTPGDKVDPAEIDIITTLQTGRLSRYNSKESLALSETLISRTNSVQSIHSILSNQSRRSSSNPFDIEVNTEDQQLDENVPNLIAELTQEFYKTIGNLGEEEEIKQENQSQEKIVEKVDDKPKRKNEDNLIKENTDKDNEKVEEEIEDKEILNKIEDELEEEAINNETSELEEKEKEEKIDKKEEIPIENLSDDNVLDNTQFDELGNLKRDFEELETEQELNKQDLEEVQNYIKEQIPFDPFETIVEDEPTNSNRQSVSSPNDLSSSLSNKNLTNKQNSLEKDSAFIDVPSNENLNNNKSEFSDKNDLNNNSKQFNEPVITEVSTSSDQSLVIDEQLLTTNDYFDPFKTVNDLTPTSEVYTVGEDQSDLQNINNNLNTENIDNIDNIDNSQIDDLPPPPTDLDYPEEEEENNFFTGEQQTEPDIVEIMDDDLPPPPPELTETPEETQEHEEAISQPKVEEPQDEPIEEAKIEEEILSDNDKPIDLPEESINAEEQENDKESVDKEKTVEPEEIKSKEIDLGLNLDDNTISNELSNLVVDPFDTSIYNYETIKSFIPVASKDQIDEFNQKFNTQNEEGDKSSDTYLDPFKSPLPQRKLLNKNKDGFDTFDPFITKPPKNTPVLKRKQVKKAKSTSDTEEDSSDFSSSESEPEKLKFVIKARMKEDIDDQENIVVPLIPGPPQTPTKSPKHQLRGVYNKPLLQVGRNRAKIREEYKRIHKKSLEEAKEEEVDTQMYANLRKKWEEEHPDEVVEDAPLFVEDTTALEDYDNPLADPLEWNFYVRIIKYLN